MKKTLIFLGGIITGILLLAFLSLFVVDNSAHKGLTLFEKEGECISTSSFKVIQVLDSGNALANEIQGSGLAIGVTVLFLNEGNSSYYDEQIIDIPRGKCARQIGVFKYTSRADREKTIPAVVIREK